MEAILLMEVADSSKNLGSRLCRKWWLCEQNVWYVVSRYEKANVWSKMLGMK